MRRPQNRPCKAHKTNGDPCPNFAMHGQLICAAHGGRAPQNRQAGRVRVTEMQLRRAMGELDVVPVEDPLTALSELAGEVLAWKRLASAHVAVLEGMSRDNLINGAEEVRASITVFERALDRAVTVLATIAKLNIDERLARIRGEQARQVAELMRKVLGDQSLGLSEAQRSAAPAVIRRYIDVA